MFILHNQNPRQRQSLEVTTAQRIYPHTQGGQLHEQRWGSLQPTYELWPFISKRHVTTCLIKFAIGKWSVRIRYRFCILGV